MAIKTLVVDNNPVLLQAVAAILSQEGCIVKTAGTGLAALEILSDYDPDIVFTDLIMPLVSGEQLCRILRNTQKHQDIFIVVLSAIILEDQERIIKEINCDLCVAKGSLQELRRHIREALDTYRKKKTSHSTLNIKNTRIPIGLLPSEVTSELLSEKKHLAMILANLNEGILEVSSHGKIVTANRAALNILSSREELLIGMAFTDAIIWGPLKDSISKWTTDQLVGRGMGIYEIVEEAPLQLEGRVILATLLPIAEGEDVFGLCILHDITRQFQAEEHNRALDSAIKLAKKMDALSCMAGGVAHDFNNLLTVICGNLDILTHYGDKQSNAEKTRLLEQARSAALVAVDLTRQISCFSNFGIISRESVNVSQLVRSAADTFLTAESGKYTVTIESNNILVYVDPDEMAQAIANVLKNALEASSDKRVEIGVTRCVFDGPQLMCGQYVSAGTYARIDIRDFGKGIGREQLLQIFDPYYSTKERGAMKGMGLGLTVVYATLRNHGGHVAVQSAVGKGTTVSFYLPIMQGGEELALSGKATPRTSRNVLLIEPNEQMREVGRIMLEHLGYNVFMTSNRAEALSHLRVFAETPLLPRPLVLLDLSDSQGESAIETCRLLREVVTDLQVIAMSGSILDPVMAECQKFGFINTLSKPYTMDSLKHITGMAFNA